MFRFLRLRLTLLYLFGALLLVSAVGAAVYFLLQNQFQAATDVALEHRAALALNEVGESLPPALSAGEREWYAARGGLPPTLQNREGAESETEDGGESEAEEDGPAPTPDPALVWQAGEPEFDAELSPIALAALRSDGGIDFITGRSNGYWNADAADAALSGGIDLRTGASGSGERIRVLTIRLLGMPGYSLLQVSRSLADQDRILADLLRGLLEGGAVFAAVLAGVAWLLSGSALRSAQEAWDKQQAFIAHAGHELRTPLTMIRAAAEITQRKLPADDSRRGPVAAIIAETDRLSRLVGDLLLLSRLDAHALRMVLHPVRLAPLIAELAESFGLVAGETGVRLEAGGSDATVTADEFRLRQVLLILLDNALRHTPAGGAIEIRAVAADRRVRLTIRDHGAGIPPEEIPRLFDRFYRGRDEHPESGSGLGLAIAKELVEAMHGRIRIESGSGSGTAAIIDLPAGDSKI